MTAFDACPICATPRPANRTGDGPWCCSIACFRAFHGTDGPHTPGGDGVTMPCPACQRPFRPAGQQRFCCDACRVADYRRREAAEAPVVVPRRRLRQPITVYICSRCGARAADEQRCDECRAPMRRVGLGGSCPCCDEPISVDELLVQEVVA